MPSLLFLHLITLTFASVFWDTNRPFIGVHGEKVDQATYDNLVRFTKFSSASYISPCPSPLGNTLVKAISNDTTDTQAYVARDDNNKQIIAAFRGSQQVSDFVTDAKFLQTALETPGVDAGGAVVHIGFLEAWNSIAPDILSTVKSEADAHSDYTVVITGHSLGGALASLAGLTVKSNFPNLNMVMYTFGQPRTGDAVYANLVEKVFGADKIYRAVHTFDGVATIPPQFLGYEHHGTQYWQDPDPAGPDTTTICVGHEDPNCSDSIISTGINPAHISYFDQRIGLFDDTANCDASGGSNSGSDASLKGLSATSGNGHVRAVMLVVGPAVLMSVMFGMI